MQNVSNVGCIISICKVRVDGINMQIVLESLYWMYLESFVSLQMWKSVAEEQEGSKMGRSWFKIFKEKRNVLYVAYEKACREELGSVLYEYRVEE